VEAVQKQLVREKTGREERKSIIYVFVLVFSLFGSLSLIEYKDRRTRTPSFSARRSTEGEGEEKVKERERERRGKKKRKREERQSFLTLFFSMFSLIRSLLSNLSSQQ
jgi:nitrate reductase NapE component